MASINIFLIGMTLCGLSQMAVAGDAELSKQFLSCMDKSDGVTANMLDCLGQETKRQDVRLGKVYKEVMSQLEPARKQQLLEAQRAWIKFRDANCKFYNDPDGGTLAMVSGSNCFMLAIATRAKELEGFKE